MKKCVFLLSAVLAVVAGLFSSVRADEPIVVAAARNVNSLFEAGEILSEKIDQPYIKVGIAAMKAGLSDEGPFGGFDLNRPFGLIIDKNNGSGALLPIKDWALVQQRLTDQGDELQDLGDGKFKFIKDDNSLFIIKRDNWLVVSPDADTMMKSVPENAIKIAGKLLENNLAAVYFNTKAFSQDEINQALDCFFGKIQFNEDRFKKCPMAKTLTILAENLKKNALWALKKVTQDGCSISCAWRLDKEKGIISELCLRVKPDTDCARFFNGAAGIKTDLSGFYDADAAFSGALAGNYKLLTSDQRNAVIESHQNKIFSKLDRKIQDETVRSEIKETVSQFLTLLNQTLSDGNKNCAASLYASPEKGVTFVGARFSSDGYKLESLLFNAVENGCKNGCKKMSVFNQGIEKNVAEINGVRIHTVSFKLPEKAKNYETWKKLLQGDTIVAAIGFGSKMVCLGVGTDGLNQLKAAITRCESGKSAPIFQSQVRYGDIARTVEAYYPFKEKQAEMFNQFKKSAGEAYNTPCREKTSVFGIENGVKIQNEISFEAIKIRLPRRVCEKE